MQKNIIKSTVPDKVCEADIYTLVKSTGVIYAVNMNLYIQDEDGTCPLVTDNSAMLSIREMFADPKWQPYLGSDRIRRLIQNLKTDPNLQISAAVFKHSGLLKFKNGVWDIEKGGFAEKNNELLFNRAININISENLPSESQEFQKFCRRVFTENKYEQKKRALYEVIGYCISDITNVKKAVFLIGPANCGKSVIIRFIQKLVGEDNVSNISLSDFSHKFSPVEMFGKTLNISGEIPSGALPGRALDVFKSITGGDRIELERKGSQPFSAVVDTKLLFAGNTLPIFSRVDGTNSLIERLHILLFDNAVDESEIDINIEEKLWQERSTIVRHSLEALHRFVLQKNTFIKLEDEFELLSSLTHVANPIKYFIETCMEFNEEYAVHISDAYESYRRLAANEALPDVDRTTFRNLMITQPGISVSKTKKRLGKKSPRVCFQGVKLKELLCDNEQDTEKYDK